MTSTLEGVDSALHTPEIDGNRTASVYRIVSKQDGERCEKEGIALRQELEHDQRGQIAEKVESIFAEVLNKRLKTNDPNISRKKCIFAFPRDPSIETLGLSFNPDEQAILSFDIDPKKALICEGVCFTEACIALRRYENDEDAGMESARSWAEEYWNTAEVFDDYLRRIEEEGGGSDYLSLPEVLIFQSVPKEAIRRHI